MWCSLSFVLLYVFRFRSPKYYLTTAVTDANLVSLLCPILYSFFIRLFLLLLFALYISKFFGKPYSSSLLSSLIIFGSASELSLSNAFSVYIKHKQCSLPLSLYISPGIRISPIASLVPLPFRKPFPFFLRVFYKLFISTLLEIWELQHVILGVLLS